MAKDIAYPQGAARQLSCNDTVEHGKKKE